MILPARKVPVSVKDKFRAELKRLQDLNVIAPVDQPTEWVSQFVVAVKKSGDVRVCIDPKPLNAALKRERYQIPVIDDVLPDLAEACVFTKVNLASAFWQWELDDESSLLTTFGNSPWDIPLASFTVWLVCLERDISKASESRVVRPAWCEVYCR